MQQRISKSHLSTGRAVDQLRRQLGIILTLRNGDTLGACPIEGLSPALLSQLSRHRLSLLISGARARSLGFKTENAAVRFDASDLPYAALVALADPLSDKRPPKNLKMLPATPADALLLTLVKYASLLPGALVAEGKKFPAEWLPVSSADIEAYWSDPPLDIVELATAALPIASAQNATLTSFRTRYGTSTHMALIFGDVRKAKDPLVRIHSSCITGDLLGSLRCDCGDQLQSAIEQIAAAGTGVLLYMHQEGRGIGIANKLRAYALQERGVDTYEANLMLGFEEDERDFSIASAMLKHLGVKRCRLLTNNPQKIAALKKQGITVTKRLPLIISHNAHNHAYLTAKGKKAGHLL